MCHPKTPPNATIADDGRGNCDRPGNVRWQNLVALRMTDEPMPLVAGASLGPYRILALLGAGGMGEVYRATDTRLKRDVAIKVLPDGFATDPERLARFQREAELLATLNHPNIAAIYGLEKSRRGDRRSFSSWSRARP